MFAGGHIRLVAAIKGPNVILGLYKCNYSLTSESSVLLLGRNKALGRMKQGGGLDSACGPCFWCLCIITDIHVYACTYIYVHICICTYVYISACVCICMCVYIKWLKEYSVTVVIKLIQIKNIRPYPHTFSLVSAKNTSTHVEFSTVCVLIKK